MRRVLIIGLFFVPFVSSCGPSISYSEYRGGDVLQGKGGTVEAVDGMDVWTNGTPDRKYRILGVIDYECTAPSPNSPKVFSLSGPGLISLKDWRAEVLAKARVYGGDAILLIERERYATSVSEMGSVSSQLRSKWHVVKYMD
jgi:hypothetical protein